MSETPFFLIHVSVKSKKKGGKEKWEKIQFTTWAKSEIDSTAQIENFADTDAGHGARHTTTQKNLLSGSAYMILNDTALR